MNSSNHMKIRKQMVHAVMNELNESDGLLEPETSLEVKMQLYNTYIRTKMMYGVDNMYLSPKQLKDIKSFEGSTLKTVLGILDRTHTSRLFDALNVLKTEDLIKVNKTSFFLRLCENELTRNLIREVLRRGVIKQDSLINEIREITQQNELEDMHAACQFLPSLIKNETKVRANKELKLLEMLKNLPKTMSEVLTEIAAFGDPAQVYVTHSNKNSTKR